jgi:hypothetical protein
MDFYNKSLSDHFIRTEFEVRILKTVMHGVCFTLSFTDAVEVSKPSGILIKRQWDIIIYFHNEGEQFWLSWYKFPILVTSLKFNINAR